MTSQPAPHLEDIKRRIDARAYVVDPVLVAEALLRRGPLFLLPLSARSPRAGRAIHGT